MRRPGQRLLRRIIVHILLGDIPAYGLQVFFDLTICSRRITRAGVAVGHTGLVLPERKQEILFPPDMPFKAPFESLFRFRHVLSFQRLK